MSVTATIRQSGSITIVDIAGRFVLGEESASVRNLVNDLLSKGQNKILLNLGEVDFIDTSGLGFLTGALIVARKRGGEVKLLNLTRKIHDVMQITRLDTVFDILDDEATAVRSFSQAAGATS